MKVGLVGCGAIGGTLARAIVDGKAGSVELVGICDVDLARAESLRKRLATPSILVTTKGEELIARRDIELILEAASQDTVRALAPRILESGKNMLIMSVGALADEKLYADLERKARESHVNVYLPSGAICGLDGIKSASIQEIHSVTLTTTKHPKSLEGAPYLREKQIDSKA